MSNYRYIHPERKKAFAVMSNHFSSKAIAKSNGVSVRTIQRVTKRWRTTGQVAKRSIAIGRPRILSSMDVSYLEGLVERTPDIYLSELQSYLEAARDIHVSEDTIQRALWNQGWTRKKLTPVAEEADPEAQAMYEMLIGDLYQPEQLVFVDESACNRHVVRRSMGWALRGDRARRHYFFVRGTRYSILPAISLDGVLHLDILTRSWTGEEFSKFISTLLDNMNPFPQRNSVIIMDNAGPHLFDGLREMVEARGMRLIYLPPYSPHYNPIEEGFSATKAWIRRHRDEVFSAMAPGADILAPIPLLFEAVFSAMTVENIEGWFHNAGYL